MGYLVHFHKNASGITLTEYKYANRCTRFLGTVAAAVDLGWRGYFWPERFSYVFTPYGTFLFLISEVFDVAYAVIFWYIRKKEASSGLNKAEKAR